MPVISWDEDPESRPNFNELYEMFTQYAQQPNLYLHSRATSSIATGYPDHSTGGDTRSRTTLYPSFHLSSDRPNGVNTTQGPSVHVNPSAPVSNSTGIYGSGHQLAGIQSARRFDPRRRMRSSFILPPALIAPNGRFARYQSQKRRSTCVPSEHTLSTSLSRTSSALGDPWNSNNPAHHSHPVLADTHGPNSSNPINRKYGVPTVTTPISRTIHPFHAGNLLSTDSRTSSGQPLLSSDQDSSLSQLVLSNLGYNSSESRSSMIGPATSTITTPPTGSEQPTHVNVCQPPSSSQLESATESCTCSTHTVNSSEFDRIRNSMPPNFEIEAAAGYVWPQWPSAFAQSDHMQAMEGTEEDPDPEQEPDPLNSPQPSNSRVQGDSDDNLPFLNRQLWLRRSARQRQYYLRQWQIHRSAMGMALPELATEEAIAESENARIPTETGRHTGTVTPGGESGEGANESDAEDPADRYCPDPTSTPGTLER
ncbi:unnamed protein product [Echinostoma caproni]|uniref:RING-type domain-containing protein n=1 Tax=Echinostoma caproni TaxID=27848 RepID=A0A183AC22_9TREM|nr:unnamed protein product [Echinostoma caproni]